ncbi:MAG: hypothetical protein ACP5KB_04475 [Thermoprotei archaeon]
MNSESSKRGRLLAGDSANYYGLVFEVFAYGLSPEEVDEVINTLNFFRPEKIEVSNLKEIPEFFFDLVRRQYNGFLIAKWVSSLRTIRNSIVLGILNVDAYVSPLNFIFGIALPELNVATVYVVRLRIGSSKNKLLARIRKEVIHEIGHVFGLRHCQNKSCVMSFSNSLADVDEKDFKMCNAHYAELKKRLPHVGEELLLRSSA